MPGEEDVEARWLAGDGPAAHDIAATLTIKAQKTFAIEALAACCDATNDVPSAVRRLVDVGREAPHDAHAAFSAVRELTLASDASVDASPRAALLEVAENAAKVIYNATAPTDPFDLDSGSKLLHATAAFRSVLPMAARAELAKRLLASLQDVRSSTGNAKQVLDPDLLGRWFIGDAQATRALAARISSTQLAAFARSALVGCTATLTAPPNGISRVVEAVDRGEDHPDLSDLSALTEAERARALPSSQEARLWSVAEQALHVIRSTRARANVPDGYFLLLATALFYVSVGEDNRALLRRDLAAAMHAAWV